MPLDTTLPSFLLALPTLDQFKCYCYLELVFSLLHFHSFFFLMLIMTLKLLCGSLS